MHQSLTERWNRISLRSKITGVTVLMLTLGLLVSGIGTMAMLRQYVIQQVDAQLQADAQTTSVAYTANSLGQNTGTVVPSDYFVALYDENGALRYQSWTDVPARELPQITMPLDLQSVNALGGQTMRLQDASHDTEFLAVAVPLVTNVHGTYGTLVMAVSLKQAENTVGTYLTIFLGFGLGVAVAVVAGAVVGCFLGLLAAAVAVALAVAGLRAAGAHSGGVGVVAGVLFFVAVAFAAAGGALVVVAPARRLCVFALVAARAAGRRVGSGHGRGGGHAAGQ